MNWEIEQGEGFSIDKLPELAVLAFADALAEGIEIWLVEQGPTFVPWDDIPF